RLSRADDPTHLVLLDEREVQPAPAQGFFSASETLAARPLTPGQYTIQARIANNGQELGTVSSVFRKGQ
ncbi:MAG TPA: hypothetical protein VIX35_00675, partial [Vicinamibacterales bacterium]